MNPLVLTPTRDADGAVWLLNLDLQNDGGPVVVVSRPGSPSMRYLLATFADAALRGNPFNFSPDAARGMHQFLPVATRAITQEALTHVPATLGRLSVKWTADEPEVPF